MKPAIEHIDIAAEELVQLLERAREALPEEDYRKLKAALETLEYLTELVADKDTTIRHLRQLLLPASEKTKAVLEKIGIEPAANTPGGTPSESEPAKAASKGPGHGRNRAAEFTGAHRVEVPHPAVTSQRALSGVRDRQCLTARSSLDQRHPDTAVHEVRK